jgi:DHA1 family 2-module integral membrane pump EmrD-like MFS transporter
MQSNTNYSHRDLLVAVTALLITVVSPFALDSYTPSLPAITRAFNSSAHTIQLTISLYLCGVVISQLFYGPLSDRFGRRLIVLLSLSITIIGTLFCALAKSPDTLILARLVQGIGAGGSNVLFRAILRDQFSGLRMSHMASYMSMAYTVMLAAAPIIGGHLQAAFGWRSNFIFLILLFSAITFLCWLYLPETNQSLNKEALRIRVLFKNYLSVLTHKKFIGYVGCSSLAFSGFTTFYTMGPFLLQNGFGLSAVVYGWLSAFLALGLFLGTLLNSIFVLRFDTTLLLKIGLLAMALSGLALLLASWFGFISVYAIMIATCIFIIGGGLVFSNAMAGAFEPFPRIAGIAGALYGTLQVLGAFITSLIIAELPRDNQSTMAIIFMVLGALGLMLFYAFISEPISEEQASLS